MSPTAVLWISVVALSVLSLYVGPANLSAADVVRAMTGHGNEIFRVIVWELRMPRLILSLSIGATLGLAGAAIQGYARNPLASAEILGIPAFASLGAVIAIHLGAAGASTFAVPTAAIVFAFAGTALLFLVAGRDGPAQSLLLAGLALSSLAGSLVSLALSVAPNPYAVTEIAFWLLGSLTDRSFAHVWLALPFMMASWLLFMTQRRSVVALSLGEDAARSLGVSVGRTQLALALGVAFGIGAGVAVAGGIGFIGLVVPHLVRPFFGYDPARIFVPSALAGAALLTAADIAVRLIPANGELRVGVVTALLGVPFFLLLVWRHRHGSATL